MFLINLDILPLLKPVISSFRQTEPLPGFALSLRFFARARRKVHLKKNRRARKKARRMTQEKKQLLYGNSTSRKQVP